MVLQIIFILVFLALIYILLSCKSKNYPLNQLNLSLDASVNLEDQLHELGYTLNEKGFHFVNNMTVLMNEKFINGTINKKQFDEFHLFIVEYIFINKIAIKK